MGISFSCPFAALNDLENAFESVIAKSFNFGEDEAKTPVQPKGSGMMMMIEGCVTWKATETETETMVSVEAPSSKGEDIFTTSSGVECKEMDYQSPRSDSMTEKITHLPILDKSNPKHEAAVKLQKVYKSFRTRRKLADCAVLIEQSWWKLLDFAELKRSSISFFDMEKHETAVARWSRARTRAARVGKGLSKNGKAQKLALQHWLEAIDPRHRYGHNLQFYYLKWLHCQSKEPFFYWLDIGEGKEVNLVDKCPRSKLQQQCIKYLGPMERKAYEVIVEDGKLVYKHSGEHLDSTGEPKGAKWIFVLSTSMTLYVGQKKKGTFQHSSFLAGGATSAAGRIVVEKGILKAVSPHSGHYKPTPENFQDFISFLKGNNVDLTDVKTDPVEEEESLSKQSSLFMRSISSEEDLNEKNGVETKQMDVEDKTSSEKTNTFDGYEKEEEQDQMSPEQHLFDEDQEDEEVTLIPQESILKRINLHKGMNSYQLGKQLSCKWTTGAGPRIGCVRDYPSKLQFHALEQVNLLN